MDAEIVRYLREIAHTCVAFARGCPHGETAHGLEELAADLMAKALELEKATR
jgi:hypothetical protein